MNQFREVPTNCNKCILKLCSFRAVVHVLEHLERPVASKHTHVHEHTRRKTGRNDTKYFKSRRRKQREKLTSSRSWLDVQNNLLNSLYASLYLMLPQLWSMSESRGATRTPKLTDTHSRSSTERTAGCASEWPLSICARFSCKTADCGTWKHLPTFTSGFQGSTRTELWDADGHLQVSENSVVSNSFY